MTPLQGSGRERLHGAWLDRTQYSRPHSHQPFYGGGEVFTRGDDSVCPKRHLCDPVHYTNVVEPMKAVITGMTRDGTFLIEEGEIKRPIKNLRFTESILEALSRVDCPFERSEDLLRRNGLLETFCHRHGGSCSQNRWIQFFWSLVLMKWLRA